MGGKLRAFLVFLLFLLIGERPLLAQKTNYPIIIKSNPNGASVELVGDYTIIGQTPCHIRQELAGRFYLKVLKSGYETKKQFVDLAFNEPRVLNIHLKPKERWKAGWRSCVLPGWGHFYSEKPVKGFIIGTTFLTSFVIRTYAAHRYDHKVEDYEKALAILNQPLGNIEFEQQSQIALEKGKAADDAFELKKKWTWITTSIFVYNLIDALIFFPKFRFRGIMQTNMHFSLNKNTNTTGCSLSVQF